MASDLIIEDLTEATQGEVADLILAGLAEHWGTLDPELNTDLHDMMASYAGGRTVVARDGHGTLLGTGTIIPTALATTEIVRMSVAPNARRLGVGRRIVDELLDTARRWEAERVILETTSTWTSVVEFYLRCGFVITHTAEDDFGPQTLFEYRLTR